MKIEESMMMEFEYLSPFAIDIEESSLGVAIINGTLLAEGVSRNGNLYTLDEMDNIAKSAEGAPIYCGTMRKFNEFRGVFNRNAHANVEPNRVGRIIKTWVDTVARKIRFLAEIVNTDNFPHLIEEVKTGWGVSIGGKGLAQWIRDNAGRIVTKISNLAINHIQLLPPNVIRGQDEAQVEGSNPKEIQETMFLPEFPKIKGKIEISSQFSESEVEFKGF